MDLVLYDSELGEMFKKGLIWCISGRVKNCNDKTKKQLFEVANWGFLRAENIPYPNSHSQICQ